MPRGFIVELLVPEPHPKGGEVLVVGDKRGPFRSPISALRAWDDFRKEPGTYVNIRRGVA